MKAGCWSVPLVLLVLSACGPSDPTEKIVSGLKEEIVKNYENNKQKFDRLNAYFHLKHINYIEFPDNNLVTIRFGKDSTTETRDYQTLENQGMQYDTLKKVLQLDNLTTDNLLEIKDLLHSVNATSFRVIDFYDEKTREKCKGIELEYKENTPLYFGYRHFEKSLEGKELVSDQVLTYKIVTGSPLGDKTLWYWR